MAQRRHNYDILAVDLDGTLLGPDGRVSAANVSAVHAAREAGIEVIICTGRGLIESRRAIEAIQAHTLLDEQGVAPIVVAGGSMIADAATGRTLQRWPMSLDLVRRVSARFANAGSATLVLKDRDAAGFDYLIVDTGPLEPINVWWFEKMGIERRHVPSLELDEHPDHTVRVGLAAASERMKHLGMEIISEFRHEATLHHFSAVTTRGRGAEKDTTVEILEVFDPRVSKWGAIEWFAQQRGVAKERVAAIGDEVNDVAMVRAAGLGIAMGNAVPAVKEIARRHAPSHEEDGVAHAIGQILAGEW